MLRHPEVVDGAAGWQQGPQLGSVTPCVLLVPTVSTMHLLIEAARRLRLVALQLPCWHSLTMPRHQHQTPQRGCLRRCCCSLYSQQRPQA